nr:MAG TPA: Pyocin activator protein PrtN [Caudoviricetes sp.]
MYTNIVIIGMNEIIELYNITRKQATRLLNMKGCPILPRNAGEPYRVIKDEFEAWLRSRRNG